jgi:hypothetical protein
VAKYSFVSFTQAKQQMESLQEEESTPETISASSWD